jgi:hypothetical protein
MVITSNPADLSPILTINVFDSAKPSTSDLNTQDMTFGDADYGHATLNFSQTKRSNKLQKLSHFISDYNDRRANILPTGASSNGPLFSLISSMSNSRESNKDSRKRRNHRFQRARPTSSSVESPFGVTKVGKQPASTRGGAERMRRDDTNSEDTQERDKKDMEINTVRTAT